MSKRLVLVGLLVAGLATTFVVGCGGKVSKSNYDKIENGMTVEEVKDILGEPAKTTGGGVGALSGKVMTWEDGDKQIVVTFANDKVTLKSQTGL